MHTCMHARAHTHTHTHTHTHSLFSVCWALNGYARRAGVRLLYILHLQLPLPLGYKMDLNEKEGNRGVEEGGREGVEGGGPGDSLCVTGGLLLLWHGYGDGGAGSLSLLSLPPSLYYRLAALSVLLIPPSLPPSIHPFLPISIAAAWYRA